MPGNPREIDIAARSAKRPAFGGVPLLEADRLTFGEAALLIEGLEDDVSFFWALIRLGIRTDRTTSTAATAQDVEKAFSVFRHLLLQAYCEIGRLEIVEEHPDGQMIVRHIPERLEAVFERVQMLCSSGSPEWPNACWFTNTEKGDDAVHDHLRLRLLARSHATANL